MKILKNNIGFTLIEVTIAIGILTLVFIGIFNFYAIYNQGLNTASNQAEIVTDAEMLMYSLNDCVRNSPAGSITLFGDDGNYISGRKLRINNEEYYFEGYRYIENGTEVISNPGNDDYYRLVYTSDVFSAVQNSRVLVNRIKKVINPSGYYQFFEIDKTYSEASVDSKRTNWISLSSLSNGIHSMAYGEYTNQLYILGGRRGSADLTEVWRFDPSTEVWSSLTPSDLPISSMPVAASGMACCYYNNGIWLLGGGTNGIASSKVMVYYPEPSGNNWVQDTSSGGDDIVSLPTATSYAGACMINLSETPIPHIRIYVFGGFDLNNIGQTTVQSYDFNTHTWHQDTNNGGLLSPIPVGYGVGDIKAEVVGEQIYIFSGYTGTAEQKALLIFSPKANFNTGSWEIIKDSAFPDGSERRGYGSVVYDDKLFIIGGIHNGTYSNRIDICFPYLNGGTWEREWYRGNNENLSARTYLASVLYSNNNVIYSIGGYNGADSTFTQAFNVYKNKKIMVKFNIIKKIKETFQEIYISTKINTQN